MAHDIFISYSQSDKAAADAVCHRLEDAGLRCWIAPRDVGYGKSWADAIVEAIADAKLVVVIFSAAANASRHVLNEVATALDAGKTVIPFRIEDIRPTVALRLHLGPLHWLDALSPPLDAYIDRLIDSARRSLPAATNGKLGSPHQPTAEPPVQVGVAPLLPQAEGEPSGAPLASGPPSTTGLRHRLTVAGLLVGAAAAIAILVLSLYGAFNAPSKVPGDEELAREAVEPPPLAPASPAAPPTSPPGPKEAPTPTPLPALSPAPPGGRSELTPHPRPFDEANVRALAAKLSVPLPQAIRVVVPSSAVPEAAVEYLGAWGGDGRWSGVGRHMILLVTNIDVSGEAIGILAEGPPNPNTLNQLSAGYNVFTGKITNNGLEFENRWLRNRHTLRSDRMGKWRDTLLASPKILTQ